MKKDFTTTKAFLPQIQHNRAFTLAEVLITLGIIGVVAALTLPTLISAYKKKEYSTRIKKFYSVMSQVIRMAEAEHGESTSWKYIVTTAESDGSIDYDKVVSNTKAFMDTYIIPYLNNVTTESDVIYPDFQYPGWKFVSLSFNDGSTVHAKSGDCLDMYYDVNGSKAPNKDGYDRYTFAICLGGPYRKFATQQKPFITWGASPHVDSIYNDYSAQLDTCKNSGSCARFLQMNNFEYPDNYPFKL